MNTILNHSVSTAVPAPATGPLRVNPANPRYFTDDSEKAIYLTGSHTWPNIQDYGLSDPPPVFDYGAFLDFLQINGHNFMRLWTMEQTKWAPWTNQGIWFEPSPFLRTGPDNALDGKPKFDLSQYNQAYFDRLRARVIEAGERGIYVSVMLFNGWSVGKKVSDDPGNPWPGHPFHASNNINGIDGDPNGDGNGYEIQALAVPEATAFQEAYVRKVIDTVNDLDNVLYEISNESHSDSTAWQYHMIEYIKSYEATLPKQHPVGMTSAYPNGNNEDLFNSPADWISPNTKGGYKSSPPAANGEKVIIADTDHLWGLGGTRRWVWTSFTRGIHPIFMDCYNPVYCENRDPNLPAWESVRRNMGYTLAYANRMNLAAMAPHGELCSSGYCLANPVAEGAEYLVYLSTDKSVRVDLSGSPVELFVEWFDPENGTREDAPKVLGGKPRNFSSPFRRDSVLYIYQLAPVTPTPTMTSTATPTSTQTPTSTLPPATETPSASPTPSATPAPPTTPLSCVLGFLSLSGLTLFGAALFRSSVKK